jgi:hypothetical protein
MSCKACANRHTVNQFRVKKVFSLLHFGDYTAICLNDQYLKS